MHNLLTNPVGYQTVTQYKGTWLAATAQFNAVGGTDAIPLVNAIKGDFVPTVWDEDDNFRETAPQVLVPQGRNTTAYNYAYYLYLDDPETPFWFDGGDFITEDSSDFDIQIGTAFWFIQNDLDTCQVTIAGEVFAQSGKDIDTCANTWALLAYPYPIPFDIVSDKVTFDGMESIPWDEDDAFRDTAPQILVPQGPTTTAYNYAYWLHMPDDESNKFWFDGGDFITEGNPDYIANPGVGFWFLSGEDVTVKFTK